MTGNEVALEGVPWIDLPAPGRPRVLYGTRTRRRPDPVHAHQKEIESRIDYARERRL
jgi:hypothetical protein